MGKNLGKSLSELISSHCDLYNEHGDMLGACAFQLDYLRFYVPEDKWILYGTPRNNASVRDNPNWESTEYDHVFKMVDYKYCIYQYVIDGYPPVAVLRWAKVKINGQEKIEVCIYGKALKLYYSGHLSWLRDFVIKYGGKCTRADLCWDFKDKIPGKDFQLDCYTDLTRSGEYPNSDASDYDTIYYGKRHSPFFIRVYNKTEDLRKDKNIYSWLYPKWYMEKCWRLEIELKGAYASICDPLSWLDNQTRDMKIQTMTQTKRNVYKTGLYSMISMIDIINYGTGEKILILQSVQDLITQKLKNLIRN